MQGLTDSSKRNHQQGKPAGIRSRVAFDYMSIPTYNTDMPKPQKPLVWLHGEIKTPPFSANARIEAGVLLRRLQDGEKIPLPHSRPMPSIGKGCHELRIQDTNAIRRIVYHIDVDAIVILEVFTKTTAQTPKPVLDHCKTRLKLYRSI